jgi:hypothetical protein
MRKTTVLVLLFAVLSSAAAVQPAPEIVGIRLGMSYDKAHSRLNKIAHFKSEDEGQQVWTLNHDKHYQYVIVGFDPERKVRYVTVLVRPEGQPVRYEEIGNLAQASLSGGPGNLRYTWKVADRKTHQDYLAIAAGKDAHHLDRYSIKRLGVKGEEEDRD